MHAFLHVPPPGITLGSLVQTNGELHLHVFSIQVNPSDESHLIFSLQVFDSVVAINNEKFNFLN